MMNQTTLNTQTATFNHAKTALKSLLITLAALLTLVLVAIPETAQAFNLDELTTLVEDLTAETSEIVIADASESTEGESFRDKMAKQNETMREIGENITSKRGSVEGIANDINAESKAYVEGAVAETSSLTEVFEGVNVETLTNAVSSFMNGEEVYADSTLGNQLLQIAGMQTPQDVIMEAVVSIVRSILGLFLVASLIGLAKHQINKGYRGY